MSTDTREALAAWELTYAAFKGAFDTPQMRRNMPDEYSEDARKRMRGFNELIRAALATQPAQPAQLEAMVDKAWLRFEAEDQRLKSKKAERVRALVNAGSFPGMSEAFDAHMGAECWTDPAYQPDASTWAAAWKAAKRDLEPAQPSAQGEAVTLADVLDALNVFNKPRPSDGDEPWTENDSISVKHLPDFINIIAVAWFDQPRPMTTMLASAPAAPAQAVPLSHALVMRAEALHLNAGMPWHQAEEAALSEVGIHDAEIDELIGECAPVGLESLITGAEELRRFTRAVLVHGSGIKAAP